MTTIGAVYWCYKNKHATDTVLKLFRRSYPTETCLLISDCGDDFSDIAMKYNCKYIYSTPNLQLGTGTDNIENGITGVLKHKKYIKEHIFEDYFIVLEDDVIVLDRYSTEHLNCSIHGDLVNKLSIALGDKNISEIGIPIDTYYTGHGGSVFKTKDFIEMFENETSLNKLIELYMKHLKYIKSFQFGGDVFISALCLLSGKTIGKLNGAFNYGNNISHKSQIIEFARDFTITPHINNLLLNGIKTLHPCKLFYT